MPLKTTRWTKKQRLLFGWFICALGALFYTYEYLLRIEPGIMTHSLAKHFSLDATGVGLLASAYYWAYTPLQLIVGPILDRYGARRVLLCALSTCIAGVLLFDFTHYVSVALAGRFLMGVGSAFAFVGSLKLCADWLPKKYFSLFAGISTSLGMLGAMFGETALSYVTIHTGWHAVLTDSIWLGLLLMGLLFALLHEHTKRYGRKNPMKLKALIQDVWGFAKSSDMLRIGFIGCAMYLSLTVLAEQWGNSYVQKVLHVNTEGASYYVDLIFLGWLIGAPIQGFLSEYFHSRKKIMHINCILSLISFIPLLLFPRALSPHIFGLCLFLFALFSSAEINCFALAHDITQQRLTATVIGFINACIMLGGMIVQPFFAFCLQYFTNIGARTIHSGYSHPLSAYQYSLWIVPIFLVIALYLMRKLKE